MRHASLTLAIDGGAPVRKRFLGFSRPALGEEEIAEVVDTLRSGWVTTGPRVSHFEAAFRDRIGADHAVALNSCTAALHLSLLAAGVGEGCEVITTPLTFAATANSVIHAGARPVFVDVDPVSQNLTPRGVEAAITPRTRAVLPVHMAGYPADMTALCELGRAHRFAVIDDAAHCIEGWHRGRRIGSMGDATCFSFYATKNLTTIEGGMVTTPHESWAQDIRIRSLHGLSSGAWSRYDAGARPHYEVLTPGFKYNMTDVEAAVGLSQLGKLDRHQRRRARIWERYDAGLAGLPLGLPVLPSDGSVHAMHLYTVQLAPGALRVDRDQVWRALHAENVGCSVHFIGLHLHRYYQDQWGVGPDDFPVATLISRSTLSLPLDPNLSDTDVDDVVEAVRKVIGAYLR